MIRFLRARLGPRQGDGGVALIAVIGIGAALTILATALLGLSVGGLMKASNDQNWNAAISAAYAGVEDYQSKLANDNTYQQYGSSLAPFSTTSTFTGTAGNPAFGTGASGSWQTVPGSNGRASYRYEVDSSKYYTTGTLRLRSTGLVGNTARSIVADLKQQGFIDFLYFTNYEIIDPELSNSACVPTWAWAVPSRPNCSTIQFAANDVINGPLDSNDTLQICGSTFNGPVTTAFKPASGLNYVIPGGCAAPTFAIAGSPSYSPTIVMPPTNRQMKQETRDDLTTSTVPRPGCLFTGPTSIVFNNDGTMTVRSPWTKKTNIEGSPETSGTISPSCGTPGYAVSNTLGSTAGQTFAVPTNNLIYVQNVPSTSTDPNYWAAAATPTGLTCTGLAGSSGTGNGLGYPKANEAAPSSSTDAPSYGCRNGDVFVKGSLHAAVTIATDNYIYVTGGIKYVDPQADMLGLVGQKSIWVYNPVDSSGTLLDTSQPGIEIDAAILSVDHTFIVQNWAAGKKGTLTVKGAIAQNFRGPVGTSSNGNNMSGYVKAYSYDPRLRYTAPPKFLSPVSTTYGVSMLVEVKTAYLPSGATAP